MRMDDENNDTVLVCTGLTIFVQSHKKVGSAHKISLNK